MAKAKKFEGNDADIVIQCPGCKELHVLNTDSTRLESNGKPAPCWMFNGDLNSPTFTPSLLVRTGKYAPGCVIDETNREFYEQHSVQCHSYITAGKIQFLPDTTHALSGQTVELPEL